METEPQPTRAPASQQSGGMAPETAIDPFTGKGYLLECSDPEAFRAIDDLVKRQEPLARNRLAMDRHYTATKQGYWQSSLVKVEDQNQWVQSWLPGTRDNLRTAAVPNKQAELCQRLTETLLVDPPKLEPEPEDDDEAAQRGAELAREYLQQDATEAGTDDLTLFSAQIEGATTRASTFNYYWVDPVGGGSIPKQIKAHPQATDPAQPLDAFKPDPVTGAMVPVPTTDYVLRYVTPGDENGQGAQFTDNPSEAERVWLPRVRVKKLGREHVRLYPEDADLHHAQQAIVLDYCTVAEAKRRWSDVLGDYTDADFVPLVGWTPQRAGALLPPAIRAAWKMGYENTAKGGKTTAMDQRILFYYAYHGLSEPDYPEGAVVCVNGAHGGLVLGKETLSADVSMPSQVTQDEEVTDRKDLDIPLVQIRLLPDVDSRDPMGAPFMARIAGPGEALSNMATAMLEAIDLALHPVKYSLATSPVDPDDAESARATGAYVQVNQKDDIPQLEERRDLPGAFFNMAGWQGDQMDASAGLRPPESAQESKVKSGVALRIEVQEASKALTRMNYAVHASWSRHGRIKLQMAMKHFSVPQLIRYVGVDGAAKQEWFTGNNFARVGNITIASGSGTMLPPIEKVNLAVQLQAAQLMDADEASDVARPAFSKQLGVSENVHVQRIERQVSSWLEGPPEGWEQQQQAFVVAAQQHAQMAQQAIEATPDPRAAQIAAPPQAPWTPFAVEPMDAEPPIAAIRKRRLARLMAKVEYSKFPEPWKQVVRDAYTQAVQSVAAAQQVQQAAAQPGPESVDAGAEPMGAVA